MASVSVASGSADGPSKDDSWDLDRIRLQVTNVTARWARRVNLETLRPLPQFLGISPVGLCLSAGAYNPPTQHAWNKASAEKTVRRLKLNLQYFVTNYVAVAALVAIVVALMHPGMLLTLGVVWMAWQGHAWAQKYHEVVVGTIRIPLPTLPQRFYALVTLSLVAIVWKCLGPTLIFVIIATTLIVSHALLRDPKHIESSATSMLGAADSDDEADDIVDEEEANSNNSSESEVLVERPKATARTTKKRVGGDVI